MNIPNDLIHHLSVGVLIALPGIKWRIWFVLGIIAGIGKEIYDEWSLGGYFDFIDLVFTVAGVLVVAIPCYLIRFGISYYKS